MGDTAWPDGARVWHTRWGCTGTVRHIPYEPGEDPDGAEYVAEVRWDGSFVADDLCLVEDELEVLS